MIKEDQGDGIYEDFIKKILFFFCLLLSVFIIFLTTIAIWLDGSSFIILGIGGIVASISLGLIIWTPYKVKVYCIPLIIGMIPLYMLFPGKGAYNQNAHLEYRSVKSSSAPWFSGISEHDLVSMGEKLGYTDKEKESLKGFGGIASDYKELNTNTLFQYNSSVVLDSWLFDRGHYWFYRPNSDKRPLLIFLHGSGGNFKAYQHWFTPFAKKNKIAMAFPTWGFGTWSPDQLGQRVNEVIDDIKKDYAINEKEIYICGLSQGSLTGLKTSKYINYRAFCKISN